MYARPRSDPYEGSVGGPSASHMTVTEQAHAVVEALCALMPRDQTSSAGIATWDGHEEAAALLQRADAALNQAKTLGRDTTVTAR